MRRCAILGAGFVLILGAVAACGSADDSASASTGGSGGGTAGTGGGTAGTGGTAGWGGTAGSGGGTAGTGGGTAGTGSTAGAAGAAGSGGTSGSGGGTAGTGGGTAGAGGSGGSGGTAGSSGASGAGGTATGGSGGTGADPDAGILPDAGLACADLDDSKPAVLYLSADDSNSMASPSIARRMIELEQGLIPASVIRTYEFLNYYNVLVEPPEPGNLRVVPQARVYGDPSDLELQILVQSEDPALIRREMTITLVLDTSGSMAGSPIEREQEVIRAIAANLRGGDVVSAVSWNTQNSVILSGHVAIGPNDPAVLGVANSLQASGGTDLHAGLTTGYQLAEYHYRPEGINRVVLISDGQANVGVTDENLIGEKADDENREGIYLVGVGVGYGYNDTLMNTVTDAGNGAYVFIDDTDEAHKMFGGRFDEVMEVSARSVQLKLTMPWYFSMLQFHGEQYGTDPKKVKPQHLAPGDAMVFHQVLRACDASMLDPSDPLSFTATWVEPITFIDRSTTVQTTLGELFADADDKLVRGRAIVAYAEALKAIPSLSHPARLAAIDDALAKVAVASSSGSDAELTEIAQLLSAYRQAPGL